MNGTTLDPRDIAKALDMDTMDLARLLTKFASDALPSVDFEHNWAPTNLESFDSRIAQARRYLESAHEAMDAYYEDNPEDDPAVTGEDPS